MPTAVELIELKMPLNRMSEPIHQKKRNSDSGKDARARTLSGERFCVFLGVDAAGRLALKRVGGPYYFLITIITPVRERLAAVMYGRTSPQPH